MLRFQGLPESGKLVILALLGSAIKQIPPAISAEIRKAELIKLRSWLYGFAPIPKEVSQAINLHIRHHFSRTRA